MAKDYYSTLGVDKKVNKDEWIAYYCCEFVDKSINQSKSSINQSNFPSISIVSKLKNNKNRFKSSLTSSTRPRSLWHEARLE